MRNDAGRVRLESRVLQGCYYDGEDMMMAHWALCGLEAEVVIIGATTHPRHILAATTTMPTISVRQCASDKDKENASKPTKAAQRSAAEQNSSRSVGTTVVLLPGDDLEYGKPRTYESSRTFLVVKG